jgi:monoamine oxidase
MVAIRAPVVPAQYLLKERQRGLELGEHCSSYYQGFMNGAAETGRMAAQNILKAVRSGESIVLN